MLSIGSFIQFEAFFLSVICFHGLRIVVDMSSDVENSLSLASIMKHLDLKVFVDSSLLNSNVDVLCGEWNQGGKVDAGE